MPRMANKPCAHPGCGAAVPGGTRFCPKHAAQFAEREKARKREYEARRPSAKQRGYGPHWERLRAWKLNRNPLCERCFQQHKAVQAVMVHHLDHDPRNNAVENLQSLCVSCHETEHKRGFIGG